jgi:Ca-activated chloride channel family protein
VRAGSRRGSRNRNLLLPIGFASHNGSAPLTSIPHLRNYFSGVMDGFAAPGAFGLLAVVAALAIGYWWAQRRRRTSVLRFANLQLLDRVASGVPWWRRHASAAFVLVAMLLLIVGLAGPTAAERVPRNRAVVMLILDVSPSMTATDVDPTRLAAAQSAAVSFVEGLPRGINLGLVSFAGTATVEITPTTRHEQVAERIRAAKVHYSTATGEALATALATIGQFGDLLADDSGPPPSRVIMLSDGKQNVGRPAAQVAEEAKAAGVPVDTISYGTDDGQIELEGKRMQVPPDDELMRTVAEITGGQYHKATTAQLLEQVYRQLGEQVGYETVQGDASKPWFLLGTTALMAASLSGLVLTRRVP